MDGKKAKYATGTLSEQEISKKDKWEFDEIFSRGKKIVDFLMSYLGYTAPLKMEDYKTILLRDETFCIDN